MEHQVRPAVVGRFVPVNEDQTLTTEVIDQPCRRIHRQAGTGNDQQVRVINRGNAHLNGVLVQRFLIKDHIWLDGTAAGAAGYPFAVTDIFRAVEFSAAGAVIA